MSGATTPLYQVWAMASTAPARPWVHQIQFRRPPRLSHAAAAAAAVESARDSAERYAYTRSWFLARHRVGDNAAMQP